MYFYFYARRYYFKISYIYIYRFLGCKFDSNMCVFFLYKATPEAVHPVHMLHPVETQHLVVRTRMHPKEFEGIRLLLNNCPDLETLTFDLLPPSCFMVIDFISITSKLI